MASAIIAPPERLNLNYHLFHKAKVQPELRHLINDISRAASYISYAIKTTEAGLAGTSNIYGEEQIKLDVLSDRIIAQYLSESELVASFASEEQAEIVELAPEALYSVVFDPLDGSSLVDTNFAVGSIFGIYAGKELVGRTPREQVAALYFLYGPRTILVYSTGTGVHEFLLNDVGEFVLLRENLQIAPQAKNYSPGNLRALSDNQGYREVMDSWLKEQKTLRYSGAFVADVHHILSKGQGIFMNVGGSKYPEGKLRHVFECGPFAYLVEMAGGRASDGRCSILDKPIRSIDQRTQLIIGSSEEVERVCTLLEQAPVA